MLPALWGIDWRRDCAWRLRRAAQRPGRPRTCEAPADRSNELPLPFDDWELDEQLRHIERVLRTAKARARQADTGQQRQVMRYDAAHAGPPTWHIPLAERQRQRRPDAIPAGKSRGLLWSMVTSLVLSVGTIGVVAAAACWDGRWPKDVPNFGASVGPVAAMGQIALLVGLVLQIDRLWRHSHQTVAKLDLVDAQLHEIKTNTTLLGANQSPASIFYTHLAHGAGAQLLLTDLKSQLDLLAMKIAQDER